VKELEDEEEALARDLGELDALLLGLFHSALQDGPEEGRQGQEARVGQHFVVHRLVRIVRHHHRDLPVIIIRF
jgi:plasmid stabilization system protein ParE